MFGFFRRPAPRPVSDAVRLAIEKDARTPATNDMAQLRMVESSGRYSDRKVTYFRLFLPSAATQQSLEVRTFKDLDSHPALVVRSGHVESEGAVILTRPVVMMAPAPDVRTRAGRAVPDLSVTATDGAAVAVADLTT